MDKYCRTYHFPFSQGATNDDKISNNINSLLNIPIIISEKIDGSNCCLQKEAIFARTHSKPPTHPSFDCIKSLHAAIKYKIPDRFQFFGENAFALHSIAYDSLPGYFLLFNIRDLNKSIWLSWEEVELWAEEIEVPTVPVLFRGIIKSEIELEELVNYLMNQPSCYGDIREGVVVRIQDSFSDENFSKYVMKSVRANHVSTDKHWKYQTIIKNKLRIK